MDGCGSISLSLSLRLVRLNTPPPVRACCSVSSQALCHSSLTPFLAVPDFRAVARQLKKHLQKKKVLLVSKFVLGIMKDRRFRRDSVHSTSEMKTSLAGKPTKNDYLSVPSRFSRVMLSKRPVRVRYSQKIVMRSLLPVLNSKVRRLKFRAAPAAVLLRRLPPSS